jgi:hypothetical protein
MKALRQTLTLAALAAIVAASASCGDVVRQGRSSTYLIIDTMGGSSGGASASTASNPVRSDVVTSAGVVFNDPGAAVIRAARKNTSSVVAPTTNGDVTLTRVHVTYRRADGLNTPGADVPYSFDNAVAVTIPSNGSTAMTVPFDVVRQDAKLESPLLELRSKFIVLTVIAEVTFYGTDQVGNTVSVTGNLTVNFANYGD